MMSDGNGNESELLDMTTAIVSAYVSRNDLAAGEVAGLIRSVHTSLAGLNAPEAPVAPPPEKARPAVPISRSIGEDFIICLEDGKKLKMLKRYLRTNYNMTPEEYRKKWNLPGDYPMVAPAYAKRRSDFAKSIGLGKGVRGR